MNELFIDLETYASSEVELGKVGVYKYSSHPSFEILLFAYSVDGGEVKVVDIAAGEEIPEEVRAALDDPAVIKWAFNCSFERVCLGAWFGTCFEPTSWRCTMVWAATLGLPLSLAGVGEVLKLDEQKMKEGKELIRFFCTSVKPTKANHHSTRNMPKDHPDRWAVFKQYNKRDVETEMAIHKRLANYPVPESVWEEYHISEEINDRGIKIDRTFVNACVDIDLKSTEQLTNKLQKITGINNVNSVAQLSAWLRKRGAIFDSLGKKEVEELMQTAEGDVLEALKLRQQISKTSTKKYIAMLNAAGGDDRCRGMFQFYGANRTGRFAGRLVQLQNLPQNHIPDLAEARELVRSGNFDAVEMLYPSVPGVLSELIRTAFVPSSGSRFIVADYSAIEARVLSYLSGEEWRNKVFAENGDIYCASASAMFGVPVEKHGVNGHLRQKGKIAELALGYGGATGALVNMGATKMGLPEDELPNLVKLWRVSNPNIVNFWYAVESAAVKAVIHKSSEFVGNIEFFYKGGTLFIKLLSGRCIAYAKPKIETNKFGRDSLTYEGLGMTKKWERLETFGGKLTENIVQAISRDILLNAMCNLRSYSIVAHVHDELIIECPNDVKLETICNVMGRTPAWASGLMLRADGYECVFYKKD